MQFHTWLFALFFLVVYAVYLPLRSTRLRVPWILLASYVFYASWHPLYLAVLLYVTAVDYVVVAGMANAEEKKPVGSRFLGGWLNPLCWLWAPLAGVVAGFGVVAWLARKGTVPFSLGRKLGQSPKRPWLVLSIVNNLGLFGFFACGTFATDNLNVLLKWVGVPYALHLPHVTFLSTGLNAALGWLGLPKTAPLDLAAVLPMGMSFYILQSLTYTIDYYRGVCPRETSFLRYAEFVAFFPKLLMGPVERARNVLPQLGAAPRITWQDVADGLSLFVVGLFKKVALADALALYVDGVYNTLSVCGTAQDTAPHLHQGPALLLASFAFGWQLYFDFSGYSDMARGVARLLGVKLMLNFNNPYMAAGLGDFWRRWHISLSTWFRDYVYIPLGGNRRGEVRTYINLWLTMVISGLWHNGLWHNATWAFVIWGAIHGFGYALTRPLERTPFYQERVPRLAKQMLTFGIVTLAWVFFRAGKNVGGVPDACLVLKRIFTTGWGFTSTGWANPQFPLLFLAFIFAVWAYQFAYESRFRWILTLSPVRVGLVVLMVLYLVACGGSGGNFIYQ